MNVIFTMADVAEEEVQELSQEELLAQSQKRERKDLQGAADFESRPTVNTREFLRRFRNAQSVPFDINLTASPGVQRLLSSYSSSLDCTAESFLFPLLSACGTCMGVDARLQLTPQWHETPLLWTLVVDQPCILGAGPVNYIREELMCLQAEQRNCQQFVLDDFDLEGLHKALVRNGGYGIALYDDAETLRRITGSGCFSLDLLRKLYSGQSWTINRSTYEGSLFATSLSFSLHCTPLSLHRLLFVNNLFSSILKELFICICCGDRQSVEQKRFTVATVPDSLNLKKLFTTIYELHHKHKLSYQLGLEASQRYKKFYSKLESVSPRAEVFFHSAKYLARLACILHVLENALDSIHWNQTPDPLTWCTVISESTFIRAQSILDFIQQQNKMLQHGIITNFRPSIVSRVEAVSSSSQELSNPTKKRKIKPFVDKQPTEPTIVSVMSAGLPVNPPEDSPLAAQAPPFIALPTDLMLPQSLSVSLIPPSDKETSSAALVSQHIGTDEFLKENLFKIRRFLVHRDPCMTPARAVQLKMFRDTPLLSPKQPKYSCNFARKIMDYMAELGFGEVGHLNGSNRGYIFKKKPFQELGSKQKEMLKFLVVTETEYNRFIRNNDDSLLRSVVATDIVEIAD